MTIRLWEILLPTSWLGGGHRGGFSEWKNGKLDAGGLEKPCRRQSGRQVLRTVGKRRPGKPVGGRTAGDLGGAAVAPHEFVRGTKHPEPRKQRNAGADEGETQAAYEPGSGKNARGDSVIRTNQQGMQGG